MTVPTHFDPLGEECLADPYSVLAKLPITEAPIFYAPSIGYYVVTRYGGPAATRIRQSLGAAGQQ